MEEKKDGRQHTHETKKKITKLQMCIGRVVVSRTDIINWYYVVLNATAIRLNSWSVKRFLPIYAFVG